MTLDTFADVRQQLADVTLPPEVRACLEACENVVVPASRAELYRLALGPDAPGPTGAPPLGGGQGPVSWPSCARNVRVKRALVGARGLDA
jgi:hypothetical protein